MTIQTGRVTPVAVADIEPNPHNPRRLFDQEPMNVLKESVLKLGILVPLTLYANPTKRSGSKEYVLLDGERRWRVAQELGLQQVPAIVVEEPSEAHNILTMFHIHNVREGWQLMPTALKLHTLMRDLGEANERKLAELTKLSIAQIRRCKVLLSYPKEFQSMMLAPPTERMKADFFIELDRIRRPARADHFAPWVELGDRESIRTLLDKYEKKVIVAVTEFRHLAEIYKASVTRPQRKRLEREFFSFLTTPEMGVWDLDVPGATFAKETKEIQRSARRLLAQISDAEVEAIAADNATVSVLERLMGIIRSKLEKGLLLGVRSEPLE